jgi:hypothetical protein
VIPLKLETLLNNSVIKQSRVEYKRSWNPSEVTHAICVFVNDFTNTIGNCVVIQNRRIGMLLKEIDLFKDRSTILRNIL